MIRLNDKDGKEFAVNPDYIVDVWPNSNKESSSFKAIVIVAYQTGEVWRYVKQSLDEILNLINMSKIGFSMPSYPYSNPIAPPPYITYTTTPNNEPFDLIRKVYC